MALNPIAKLIDMIKELGLEHFGRYYGTYRARVTDNKDTESRGRILVACPQITGHDNPIPNWVYPIFKYSGPTHGEFFVPEIDDNVFIRFEAGHFDAPLYEGGFYTTELSGGIQDVHSQDELGDNTTTKGGTATYTYPDARGTIDSFGNKIVHRSNVEGEANPGIRVQTGGGSYIEIGEEKGAEVFEIKQSIGHVLTMNQDEIHLYTAEGNEIKFDRDGNIFITVSDTHKVSAGSFIHLDCGDIHLGAGTEPIILGNTHMAAYNGHTHPTAMGPSGPPLPPMAPTELSTVSSTE
jgi:hypothetical protein